MYSFLDQTVDEYMTRTPKVVTRDCTLRQLGDLFAKDDFNAYPVEDRSQVIGVVSKCDFLASFVFTPPHIMPRYDDLMNLRVSSVMTPEFIYVGTRTKLTRVLELMVNHRIRSMPVIERDQRLAGMISRTDVLRALNWWARS
ncbi:CBS domain-containing protein [Bradyrhizobium sp. STM 3562]|uniref:CBS domain-containing protein n=1 Tax=Bradyrhizobium sp. STM 3562 TaxID=578924 RepID=UPI00388D6D80